MTTRSPENDAPSAASLSRMADNMKKVEKLTERLAQVDARFPGDDGQEILGDAPGDYVKRKAND